MLSVTHAWRRRGIARKLVELAIREMESRGVQEVRHECR
jgi:predicted N-acetyltransferase YhbS